MFISEAETAARLKSSENILNRVRRDESSSALPADLILPPTIEESAVGEGIEVPLTPEIEQTVEDVAAYSTSGDVADKANVSLNSKALSKLLYGEPTSGKHFGRGRQLTRDEHSSIAVTAEILGGAAAARMAGVSDSFVGDLQRGYTSTDDRYDPNVDPSAELKLSILRKNGILVDEVFARLMTTVGLLTDDKLKEVKKATDLTRIMRDLHTVVDRSTPKDAQLADQNVHFHVWRPAVLTEDKYKVVSVGSGSTR